MSSEIRTAEGLMSALADLTRDRRENDHREWLTYDEWKWLFTHAHRLKIIDVKEAARGEFYSGYRGICMGAHFANWLYRTYRAIANARERGLSAEQFHAEFCAQVDRDSDVVKKAAEYKEQRAREAREKAENDRRRAGSDRRRPVVEDDGPIEVRVGYQPQAERTAV